MNLSCDAAYSEGINERVLSQRICREQSGVFGTSEPRAESESLKHNRQSSRPICCSLANRLEN